MPDFEYVEPESVAEACALLAEDPKGSAVFAGGTDILVDLKAGNRHDKRLVSLGRIEDLRRINLTDSGELSIGAMVTVNMVARHEGIRQRFPGINDAAMSLAAEQVRNQATVVGNLCMAVPSADMAPVLLALGATLRVVTPDGERSVPVRDLFVGPRETVLEPAEIVVSIDVPTLPNGSGSASLRQGGRVSLSLPMASAATVVEMEDNICKAAAVALGAVAPTPLFVPAVGESIVGKQLTDEVLKTAGEEASAASKPITDIRAGQEYRYELVKVLTRRVLVLAAARAAGAR